MLSKRLLSALIGIPLLVLLIYEGKYFFLAGIIFFALAGLYELRTMLLRVNLRLPAAIYFANGIFYPTLVFFLPQAGQSLIGFAGLTFFLIVHLIAMIIKYPEHTFVEMSASWLGSSYIGVLTCYLVLLRNINNSGFYFLLYVIVLTWSYDTGAYFAGINWGRRALSPKLSPKKTWEGVAGGLIVAICAAFVFQILHPLFTYPQTVLLGLLIGASCQIGDLVESVFKRLADVKDSGILIPGHGGILDRFDGILLSAPVVYFYLKLFLLH